MSRDKGHALKRELLNGADPLAVPSRYGWSCSCGVTFGGLSVHGARKVWREHKDALSDGGVA